MEEYYIGYVFDGLYPPKAAQWCNENGTCHIEANEEGSMKSLRTLIEKNQNTYLTITRRPYRN